MNLLFSFVSRIIRGFDARGGDDRPQTHTIVAEMKVRGDRADAERSEIHEARFTGSFSGSIEESFFPKPRENHRAK